MKRLFWLALGVTIGVLVMRKVSRTMDKLTPGGIADSIGRGLADLADSIGEFAGDVRHAMSEREAQLRADTGLDGTLGRTPPPQQAAG